MGRTFVILRGNATDKHPLLRGVDLATVEYRSEYDIEDTCSDMSATDNLIICGDMPAVIEGKRGRPMFTENGESVLDSQNALIREMLHDKVKRGDIAQSLSVSRQTLNKYIAANFPEYHRPKGDSE